MRRGLVRAGGDTVGVGAWPAPPAGRARAPVLALHGFCGSGADFEGLAPRLGRAVVAPDLVGHGLSRAPRDARAYALPAQLDRLEALRARLGLGRVVLLGYSLGGRLALHLALRSPASVRAVVLIGASPGLEGEAERAARVAEDAALADAALRDGAPAFLAAWSRRPLIATQARMAPRLRGGARRRRARADPTGLAHTLRALSPGALPSRWADLPSLALPVLLVTGADDARFGAIARDMAGLLPRASRVEVAGAGHAPHLERPAAVAAEVRAFLARAVRDRA